MKLFSTLDSQGRRPPNTFQLSPKKLENTCFKNCSDEFDHDNVSEHLFMLLLLILLISDLFINDLHLDCMTESNIKYFNTSQKDKYV